MVTNKGIYETQTEVQGEAMTDEQRAREWYAKGLETLAQKAIFLTHMGSPGDVLKVLTRELGPPLALLETVQLFIRHAPDCTWGKGNPSTGPECECGAYQVINTIDATRKAFLEGSDGRK